MLKVKIKLAAIDMGLKAHSLKNDYQHKRCAFLTEVGIMKVFSEIGDAFLSEILKHREELALNPNKNLSKSIPVSSAILFFATYNGIGDVVDKSICAQIEEQIFKTGMVKIGGHHA